MIVVLHVWGPHIGGGGSLGCGYFLDPKLSRWSHPCHVGIPENADLPENGSWIGMENSEPLRDLTWEVPAWDMESARKWLASHLLYTQ